MVEGAAMAKKHARTTGKRASGGSQLQQGGIIDTELEPIGPDAPLESVTRYFAAYNLVALPVVDETGHLLGAVTVDDVIDHMLPEDWRDADDIPGGL